MATSSFWQETEDWHTAGEPFRIVQDLPADSLVQGLTVAEQRFHILQTPNHPLDLLRQSLCHEPRGHADMYGGFITPPNDSGAHFGVLFWHKDGFSTACGHGTIALGRWAIAKGLVQPSSDGAVDVVVDVPSGRVVAQVVFENGKVLHVDFINVSSYQFAKQIPLDIDTGSGDRVQTHIDLSFGGAVYASVDVSELGMHVQWENYQRFISLQREIKALLGKTAHHGTYDLYAVCFFENQGDSSEAITQKNVVVFADGQIDRSPCGSGTCARLAVLLAQGKVDVSKRLIHNSIIDTTFEALVVSEESSPTEFPACIPRVRGNANLTGRHNFYIDPSDPTYPGFLFR
ncbi:hypothetical protein H2203_007630 [Taxawa tesnikishii (nom. ined.)]|nr:hypothetical protein H2203_007630 [Dothideales sp. JES 119]